MNRSEISRRAFIGGATAIAGYVFAKTTLKRSGYKSPNEKLNVAAIGAGGKGASDIAGCATENIVALCDVDWDRAARTFNRFPKAARYKDFRVMLEKGKSIDAVTISTADHTHGVAAMAAMMLGKHVYVQKPLTHTVYEARQLTLAAGKYGVATQMGNQGHSGEGVRQLCEMIWSGVVGPVREVHAWTNRPIWPQGIKERLPEEPVPSTLDWDLFLGPAAKRPYSKDYTPFKWRGWWDYGCGALGDMACHILDAANWSLMLEYPTSVECISQEGNTAESAPTKSVIRFEFPARGSMPPATIYWYDGGNLPPRPKGIADTVRLGEGNNGSYFVGDQGIITTGTYSNDTRLVPDELMYDFEPLEKLLPRSAGHYREWITACKGGPPSPGNFDYAGPFTEWVLLGNVAVRVKGKLLWDGPNMRFTNNGQANQYIRSPYRKGWSL